MSKHERKNMIGKNFVEILGLFDRPEYYIPFFKSKFEIFMRDETLKPLEFKMTSVEGIETWINIQTLVNFIKTNPIKAINRFTATAT